MTLAQVTIEIGFPLTSVASTDLFLGDVTRGLVGTGTLAADQAWVDVTPYVASWSSRRGSSRVDGPVLRYDPGTCTVLLDNSDRRFDPTNLAGPYVASGLTQVTPRRPVRIRGTWAGVTYPIFRGFVDSWQVAWEPGPSRMSTVTVTATDATKILANYDGMGLGAPVGAGELSGARVHRILDSAGWPGGDRVIAAGDTALQGTTLAAAAYTDLLLTADSELGELYVDAAGNVTFRNRRAVLTEARSTTSQLVLSDYDGPARTNLATDPNMETVSGTVVTRTNLFPNPIAGVDAVSWGGYPGTGGTNAVTRQSAQTGWQLAVGTSARATWSVASLTVDGGISADLFTTGTITPQRTYSAAAQIRCFKVQRVQCYVQWLTSAGAGIINSTASTPIVLAANTVTSISIAGLVAPANASQARFLIVSCAGTSGTVWAIGDWIEASWGHVEETKNFIDASVGANAMTAAFYGNLGPASYGNDYTYTWAGTAHASPSQQRAPALNLYSVSAGGVVISRSTEGDTLHAGSMKIYWPFAGATSVGDGYTLTGLVVGQTYTYSRDVFVPSGSPAVQLTVDSIAQTNPVAQSSSGSTVNAWVRLVFTFVATATTHGLRVVNSAASLRGDYCYTDLMLIEVGAVAGAYFDGSGGGAQWSGTPNASTSVLSPTLTYEDLSISYDDTQIVNLALIGRVGGTQQQAADLTSQQVYLKRTQNRTDLLMMTDGEAADYAGFLVYQGKDPELRFDQLTLAPVTFDGLWPHALTREFGDRITVVRNPPGGGTITRDCFIRGVSHQGSADDWRTSWTLQSATRYQFFTLDHPTLGVLDANSLAY